MPKAIIRKGVSQVVKEKSKGGGRRRKARGVKAATSRQRQAAKKLGIGLNAAKAMSESEINKALREVRPKSKSPTEPKRTPKERRELSKLIKQQKRDDADKGASAPDRIKLTAGGDTAPISKIELDPDLRKYSKARIRHLIKTGQAKMVKDSEGKRKLVTTGKYAPPAEEIMREMGAKVDTPKRKSGIKKGEEQYEGKGESFNPDDVFDKKKGGKVVYRRAGGAIRGWGAATRGY